MISDMGRQVLAFVHAALAEDPPPGVAEAAARVRVRLEPGGTLACVVWDGTRTRDALAGALEERLETMELPTSAKARVEWLDGSGHPIAGAGVARTLHATPARTSATEARMPLPTAPLPSPVLDVSSVTLPREMQTIFASAAHLTSQTPSSEPETDASRHGRVLLHTALGMVLHAHQVSSTAFQRAMDVQAAAMGHVLAQNGALAEVVARNARQHNEVLETLLPEILRANADAAQARGEAAVAAVQAQSQVALASAGSPRGKYADITDLLSEARKTVTALSLGKQLKLNRAAQAKASGVSAEDVRREDKREQKKAEEPKQEDNAVTSGLRAVMAGEVPPELAAQVLHHHLAGMPVEEAARLRTLLATLATLQRPGAP